VGKDIDETECKKEDSKLPVAKHKRKVVHEENKSICNI